MLLGYLKNKKTNVNASIHKSKTGWYYAYDNKKKMYTNMYESEFDLREDLNNGKEHWFRKEVFYANAAFAVNMA